MGNLHEGEGLLLIFFIMAEMSNLDTCSGVTSVYFHNGRDG